MGALRRNDGVRHHLWERRRQRKTVPRAERATRYCLRPQFARSIRSLPGKTMSDEVLERELTSEELANAGQYALVVEWSPEENASIVSVPGIPGIHTYGS